MQKRFSDRGFAHPFAVVVVVAVVAVIGIAGTRVMQAQTINGNGGTSRGGASQKLPADLDGILPVARVSELAAGGSGVRVTALSLESWDGQLVYQAELSDGTIRAFNARTGAKLTPAARDGDSYEGDQLPALYTIGISFDMARQTAQKESPDKIVTSIRLIRAAGTVVYSVHFADQSSVYVDVADGTIVKI